MPLPRSVVLVGNRHSGHIKDGLIYTEQALRHERLPLLEQIPLSKLERLREWVAKPEEERPLIVAAGGDGTVGGVANYVANSDAVLGIVPLGTSNDVARSLDLPLKLENAVRLFKTGRVSTVDVGRFVATNEAPRYFVHAAALGFNVTFAKLATKRSLRKRAGHFTYALATLIALRTHKPFDCTLEIEGRTLKLRLLHLSVINAPIFGGRLDLSVPDSDIDDRRLDVLAIEDCGIYRLVIAAVALLLHHRPRVGGVRLYHVRRMRVHAERPLEVSFDGEVAGRVPGEFELAADALHVVTSTQFVDK